LNDILVLGKDGLWIEKMNKDLCAPDLSSKKHRHKSGLRREFEAGLFHPMLDDATIDIINQGFDDRRVAIGAIMKGKVAKMAIESIQQGVTVGFV
jgi:hypothetical protein